MSIGFTCGHNRTGAKPCRCTYNINYDAWVKIHTKKDPLAIEYGDRQCVATTKLCSCCDKKLAAVCHKCFLYVGEECSVVIDGKLMCNNCLTEFDKKIVEILDLKKKSVEVNKVLAVEVNKVLAVEVNKVLEERCEHHEKKGKLHKETTKEILTMTRKLLSLGTSILLSKVLVEFEDPNYSKKEESAKLFKNFGLNVSVGSSYDETSFDKGKNGVGIYKVIKLYDLEGKEVENGYVYYETKVEIKKVEVKPVEVKPESSEEDKLCIVCMENKKSVTFTCGHYICCDGCATSVLRNTGKCPKCRMECKIFKIYL
jgi:hypothetical protein